MGYDTTTDEGVYALIFAVYGIIIVGTLVFAAILYVVMAFTLMGFFRKVGVEPWIAWVPIYNNWKWLEVGGYQGWLSLIALIPYGSIVTSIFLYIGMYRTGIAFGKDGGYVVLGIFFPFIWAFLLGRPQEVYSPELRNAYGWPPPLAGYGAVPYAERPAYAAAQQQAYAAQQQPYTGQPQAAQPYPGQQAPGQPYPGQQQYPGQQPPAV